MISGIPEPGYDGPNIEGLRRLADALPGMAEGIIAKKIGGKGKKVWDSTPKPRKVCGACGALHDLASPIPGKPIGLPVEETCKDCQKELDAGKIALVCISPDPRKLRRCFFIKDDKRLADKAGQIMHVSTETMDAVEREYKHKHDESAE